MLGDLIKTRGIKQKWLAAKIGVSEVTVSNWCSGNTMPNNEHLKKLSTILDVDLNVLRNLNGQK
jgi:ribosome-binding protein aMBF1 (putative translation factor)